MKYDNSVHIITLEEVRTFFQYLVNERGCNFHPDDDFAEYVCNADGSPTFTEEEIPCFNRLMDECFTVCADSNESIYDLGLEVLKKRIKGRR